MLKENRVNDLDIKEAIEIDLSIKVWTGTRTIKPEDLGIDPKSLPPEELSKFGPTKLLKGKRIKDLNTLRDTTQRELKTFCVSHMNGYATDRANREKVVTFLEERKQKFLDLEQALYREMDAEVDEWVKLYPTYEAIIRKKLPSVAELMNRFGFRYSIKPVTFWSDDEDAPENRDAVENIKGWVAEVYRDVSKTAKERLDFLLGKETCNQSSLGKIRLDIVNKLESLRFATTQIRPILDRVNSVLVGIPDQGKIEGKDLAAIIGLLHFLVDVNAMKQYAKAVKNGDVSILDTSDDTAAETEHQTEFAESKLDEADETSEETQATPAQSSGGGGVWF